MRMKILAALLTVLALLVAGCGSIEEDTAADDGGTEAADPGADDGTEGDGTESGDTDADAVERPITITDARGEEVELEGPATEVVGLEWGVVENLVSLGVMPVGVADVEGYGNWVTAAPLDEGVTDVGTRGEPSIDALVGLAPELVITTTDLPENVIAQIEEIVPVLAVRGANAEEPIDQMRENLELVAQAVGRSDDAADLLAELDSAIADGAEAIEAAAPDTSDFVLADGYLEGSTVSIRMFTEDSLVGAVGEELGLENVWEGEGDPDYGLAQTDVEGLTALDDVHFLYYANDAAEGDPFEEGLAGNAIWESLPFVEAGNVTRLPDGIWMFGGPRSVEQFIDATVDAVAS